MKYLEQERSPRRHATIIAGVAAAHAIVILSIIGWNARPAPLAEGLIRVAIVHPAPPGPASTSPADRQRSSRPDAATDTRPHHAS